jgi:hypothetical protein
LRALNEKVKDYTFVCRSDVDFYCAIVSHGIFLKQLTSLIDYEQVVMLLARMLDRLDYLDGDFLTVEVGITKGNPLSPLLGTMYLKNMNAVLGDYCVKYNLFYCRAPAAVFNKELDDWVMLCRTRQQLRTLVRLMN